jgi:YHS domain-containing protein
VADCVLWLEDGRLKALAALVRDPVCAMLLDPEQTPVQLEHGGSLLYFGSRGCRDQYEQERAAPKSATYPHGV